MARVRARSAKANSGSGRRTLITGTSGTVGLAVASACHRKTDGARRPSDQRPTPRATVRLRRACPHASHLRAASNRSVQRGSPVVSSLGAFDFEKATLLMRVEVHLRKRWRIDV